MEAKSDKYNQMKRLWLPGTGRVCFTSPASASKWAESSRRYREKLKARGPEHYLLYQQQARDRMRRLRHRKGQTLHVRHEDPPEDTHFSSLEADPAQNPSVFGDMSPYYPPHQQ
ncbi:hypothetical protein ACOMHN_036063 [Nucella lapillus]